MKKNSKDSKENKNNVFNFKEFANINPNPQKRDAKLRIKIFAKTLSDENIDFTHQRMDKYYDDFLKIEKYAECNKKLTEISEKIENIEDENIKNLFNDYCHSLNQIHDYDIALATMLGLRDGMFIFVSGYK